MAEARSRHDKEERAGAAEARRLDEQREATVGALRKLEEYEASLVANLDSHAACAENQQQQQQQAAPQQALPTSSPPVPSIRASDAVAIGQLSENTAPGTPQSSPPVIPADLGETLASLTSLRSSAVEAIEAARVIERVSAHSSAGTSFKRRSPVATNATQAVSRGDKPAVAAAGGRPTSPVEVATLQM